MNTDMGRDMKRWIAPAALCRLDSECLRIMESRAGLYSVYRSASAAILVGCMCYGFVFGLWHSWLQAMLSAAKMPLLVFSVTVFSGLINAMLAQTLGVRLTVRQVCALMLAGFSTVSILLCSFSPVVLFFALQCSRSAGGQALDGYRIVLVLNTGVVAICGLLGNLKLLGLVRQVTGSRRLAYVVFGSWMLVSGLVGCELSWVLSPFLARPDIPLPLYNPDAFSCNFFEYLWMTASGRLAGK